MKKTALITILLIAGVLIAQQILAGEQVYDFAWSEIGWISFRNDNTNAHFQLVNDDSDATWITTKSGGYQYDAYKLADPPLGSTGAITSLVVRARYVGEVDLAFRLNDAESGRGVNFYSNSSGFNWTSGGGESIARPGGGSWSWDDIEDLQVVVGLKKIPGVTDGFVSRVEVIVNGTLTLRPNATGSYTGIENSILGVPPAAPFGYGVEADRETGDLSGYAWSSNIGWISFDSNSFGACPPGWVTPRGDCQAYISFSDSLIYGWARACSVFTSGCSGALNPNRGGWDGWIKFDGSNAFYESFLDDAPDPSEFKEWAWGDNVVIGWVSLNRSNTGGAVDYKVKTYLNLNTPPVADFRVESPSGTVISPCTVASPCQAYVNEFPPLSFVNNSYDPDDPAELVTSEWYINRNSGGFVLGDFCNAPPAPALCGTTLTAPTGSYEVRLRVEDTDGAFDEMTMDNIQILTDVYADFQCSLEEGGPFVDCGLVRPVVGELIYFLDDSVPSETASTIISWSWEIVGEGAFGGGVPNPSTEAIDSPTITVRLTVQDNVGRIDSADKIILGVIPLPTWQEIAPFN